MKNFNLTMNSKRMITMYNVKFGDAFLISEGDSCALIDCGTKTTKKNATIVKSINKLNNDLNQFAYKKFLLSHYHSDHYSLLKNNIKLFRNKFDKIIVSNDFFSLNTVQIMFLNLLFCALRSEEYRNALSFLLLYPFLFSILKQNGYVCFVKKRSRFLIDKTEYIVLAPDNFNFSLDCVIDRQLNGKLKSVFKESKIFEKYCQFISECEEQIGQIDYSILDNYFGEYVENDELKEKINEDIKVAKSKLAKIINKEEKNLLKQNIKKLGYIIHKRCIVFKSIDNALLMTGDAEISTLQNISSFLPRHMGILKAPHHGTQSHYYNFRTTFDYILISHSSRKNYQDADYIDYHHQGFSVLTTECACSSTYNIISETVEF